MYEKEKELAQLSIRDWTSNEVFSLGWFIMIGIMVVAYAVWLKLVDRKRGTGLLLIGSLEAVAKLIIVAILMDNILGLYDYKNQDSASACQRLRLQCYFISHYYYVSHTIYIVMERFFVMGGYWKWGP